MDDYIAERLTKSSVKVRDAGLSGSRCIPQSLDTISTAARKDVPIVRKAKRESVVAAGRDVSATGGAVQGSKPVRPPRGDTKVLGAGTLAPPVDTTRFDRVAYQRDYMRQYRARKKAEE